MRFFKYILALSLFASVGLADTNVNTKTLQETLDNIDNWLGALSSAAGDTNVSFYLPGTNIVGATYEPTNQTWTVTPTDLSGYLLGTNILGYTYDEITETWGYDPARALAPFEVSSTNAIESGTASTYYPITFENWINTNGFGFSSSNTVTIPFDGNYGVYVRFNGIISSGNVIRIHPEQQLLSDTNWNTLSATRLKSFFSTAGTLTDTKSHFSIYAFGNGDKIRFSAFSESLDFSTTNSIINPKASITYLGPSSPQP